MLTATLESALAANRGQGDGVASATDFIGHRGTDQATPQCFLVKAGPDYTIPPHYHAVDQFQLFVAGAATLGRFPLRPGSVHYTDGHKAYGPIVSPPEVGYEYFTLRPRCSTSYHVMPAEAQRLKERLAADPGSRRMLMAEMQLEAGGTACTTLFAEDDGVAAMDVRAEPGQPLPLPSSLPYGGFVVILQGAAAIAGCDFGVKSCLWFDGGEALPPAVAGPEGTHAAVMSFGARARN